MNPIELIILILVALIANALLDDYLRPRYICPVCGARSDDGHAPECPWHR